jgi:hypothetical protein
MGTAHTLLDSYGALLYSKQRKLWKQYQNRPLESALAEAAVFRILQRCGVNPEVADSAGGPDFECADGQFMTEATALTNDKVTRETALKNEFPDETTVQSFGLLTDAIAAKAVGKHYQLSTLTRPGILAIASPHVGASLVLNGYAAECLLTSEPYWTAGKEGMSVNFSQSTFLRLDANGQIIPYHTGISAVLLVNIMSDRSYVCGAVHPAATYPFKKELLWEIPFVFLKDWPIEKQRVQCDWTLGSQRTLEVPHAAIRIHGG